MTTIMITGANRGIGLALVTRMVKEPVTVIATCRTPAKADALNSLRDANDNLAVFQLDVTSEASIEAAVAAISAETAALDVLINNAGAGDSNQTVTNIDFDDATNVLNVNVLGPMLVTKHAVPLLRRGNEPRLFNISSQLGSIQALEENRWGGYVYNASKAAMNSFTRMLAHELRADGIAVVTVHPGWVQTDMGGSNAHLTPEQSAEGIWQLVQETTIEQTNRFVKWDGAPHAW